MSRFIKENVEKDGIDRRGFLKCMGGHRDAMRDARRGLEVVRAERCYAAQRGRFQGRPQLRSDQ